MKLFSLTLALLVAAVASAQQPAIQFQVIKDQPTVPVQPGKPMVNTDFKPTAGSTPDPKSLDVNEADSMKAKELVRQLNSASYKERETATREIAKMGRFAVPALKEAIATESSPEVRLRIDLVLPRAESEDMKARVSCFMLDTEGKFDHRLPGWTKFKDLLGNDKSTRELFAEVLKNSTYHGLLLACDLPANELGAVLIGHYQGIQNRANFPQNNTGRFVNVVPTGPEIAVLAFLESMYPDREMTLTNNWNYTSVANHLYHVDVQAAMIPGRTSKYGVVLKKIIMRWLDSRETGIGTQQAMQFAEQWQMTSEIPRYAAKVLAADTPPGQGYMKTNALMRLGQNKDAKKYLPQIGKVFEDTTLLQQGQPGQPGVHNIYLGDFALGVAIKIAGQTPKDYGLEMMITQDYAKFQQNNYYFKDEKDNKAEDKRKAGIKKFKEWIAKQPKEEPKKEEPKKEEPKKEEPKKDIPQPVIKR